MKVAEFGHVDMSGYSLEKRVVKVDEALAPLYDEFGKVVGFSGRVYKVQDKNSKYMNSPESDIFIKGKTLYNYHRAKEAVRQAGFV